jgi:MoaA/NifB/PqqE/SkfB family radical SAM enzyme
VSEADALGCNVLFPASRSFPETFANDHERMYVPWSLEDAMNKLENLLKKPHQNMGKISSYNDKTIDRICDILEGKGEKYLRTSTDYRKFTRESKY